MVKFHPRLQSTVVVATAEGRVQLLDLKAVGKGSVFQVCLPAFLRGRAHKLNENTSNQVDTPSYLTSMAIAPTGEGLAFGDAEGYVHLWAAQEDAKFCRYEAEIELPDVVEPPEQIEWRDDTYVAHNFSTFLIPTYQFDRWAVR